MSKLDKILHVKCQYIKDYVKNTHRIESNPQAKNVAFPKSIMTWDSWKKDVLYI